MKSRRWSLRLFSTNFEGCCLGEEERHHTCVSAHEEDGKGVVAGQKHGLSLCAHRNTNKRFVWRMLHHKDDSMTRQHSC